MSRTPTLNRTDILDAAFNLLNTLGPQAITIRAIAAELKKSTAPIYTQYSTMEEIMTDLFEYSKEKLVHSTTLTRTHNNFLNIGLGILSFALEHRNAFLYFFITNGHSMDDLAPNKEQFIQQMKKDSLLIVLDDQRLEALLDDMWVYTYGLATMTCTRESKDTSLEYYQKKLEKMGTQLINYHLFSSGKYEAYSQLLYEKVHKYIHIEEVMHL